MVHCVDVLNVNAVTLPVYLSAHSYFTSWFYPCFVTLLW